MLGHVVIQALRIYANYILQQIHRKIALNGMKRIIHSICHNYASMVNNL